MGTMQWVVLFAGVAVAIASVTIWLVARRQSATDPAPNPGLIQPDAPPGPPGSVSPGMVDALLDGTVRPRHLFLTLIDLAVRGYLTIAPPADDDTDDLGWALGRTGRGARGLRDFETTLLSTTENPGQPGAPVTLTSLMEDARDGLASALGELRGAVARAGWFTQPGVVQRNRTPWSAIGGGVMLLGLASAGASLIAGFRGSPWIGLGGAALLVLSGLLLITLTRLRPAITPAGDRTRREVQRYRTWLQGLQPHDITAETAREMFDTNLAPALAFGLETRFADVFDTAAARHRNWGKALNIDTAWLQSPARDAASRVRLLDRFLDDAVRLADKADLDDLAD